MIHHVHNIDVHWYAIILRTSKRKTARDRKLIDTKRYLNNRVSSPKLLKLIMLPLLRPILILNK